MSRFIVVAESDDKARAIAGRAYPKWHKSFNHLYRLHGKSPMLGERPGDFDSIERIGTGIAGAPRTVLAALRAQIDEAGINYLVGQFAFGDVAQPEALRSIELFSREVMPGLKG
jgi:alkanesulfonate monooxygenase SsuD/methylene tetrahydromethanopterin reductase-like flavin-dependent oxidoreductase (luciferase family)